MAGNYTAFSGSGTSVLPLGAATAANQVLEIADLDAIKTATQSIDAKTPGLGQALAAASVPVVLTIAQLATLATEATLALLNGKVTAVNTGAVTISTALPAGANVIGHVIVDSTKAPVNTNGSIVNTALVATTAATVAVPANAVGFILEAPSDNTNNVRWCVGGTASTTVGMLAEPGRDSGYIPCGANISVCATASGTNAFSIQWILSS